MGRDMGMTGVFSKYGLRGLAGGIVASLIWVLSGPLGLGAQDDEDDEAFQLPHAVLLNVDGAIGPAALDYIERSLAKASESGAVVSVIQLDTPGGLVSTTREIISVILESPIPVAVYVAPQGARAASAGTYLLYASHVAAMSPATHMGAATPVYIGGSSPLAPGSREEESGGERDSSEEKSEPLSGLDAMERKIISDAVAYIRSLAELRGRNADWAEEAVREGSSLTSAEALEKNVIDFMAPNVTALLEVMDGKVVALGEQELTLVTAGLPIRSIEPDWRTRLLSVLADPNVAYILMLLGIYGIIFEFSNPGSLIPGIAGAIMLLLGLFALQLLPINYAGLALIGLGIALMVAEAFAPSFGALGIGGVIAFAIGSIMLMDTDVPEFEIHWSVIATFSLLSGLVLVMVLTMALRAWRKPVVFGHEAIVGTTAKALEDFDTKGRVRLLGESWKAQSTVPVRKGQTVKVTRAENLLLNVEPVTEPEPENDNPQES